MSDYLAYQAKYRDVPRDSDVELIRLISKHTPENGRVLDVGCSTGNLLRHLHVERPDLRLVGCDLDNDALDACEGAWPVHAEDVSKPWGTPAWLLDVPLDAAILNAVLYCLDDEQTATALRNIFLVLKPGGHLFIWDYLQHWEQRLTITEESKRYGKPTFHIRPYSLLQRLATEAGFGTVEFLPFSPSHLPIPDDTEDLTSWTYSGNPYGFSFRGGLAQPWCHAVLTK